MKFILGFFVGLLTGILIILGPVVGVVAVLVIARQEDDSTDVSSTSTEETTP